LCREQVGETQQVKGLRVGWSRTDWVLERPQHSEVKYIQEVGSSIAEALRRE
jgi:hypothetical protein